MNKQKWIFIALCAIFLFAGHSVAIAAHPDVPLLDKDGNPVSGNIPYSPKMTCSANACHQGDPALAAKHDYGSGSKTVTQHVGRVLADGTVIFQTQNVSAYAHGASVGKHMNQGRNENYTSDMRTAWKQHFFTSSPGMFGRYCPPSNRQLAAKDLTDIGTDPYGREMETSPSSWMKTCGVCHVGGGQLEYDRNMQPYGASSPTGDRFTYIKPYVNPNTGEAEGGFIADISQTPSIQNTELYGDNKAEVDCMLCHAANVRPMVSWYISMGCGQGGVPGPKGNSNCSSTVDPRFNFSAGAIYDIYNRNMAITRGWAKIAATAGLGVPINPMTGQLMGNTPTQISGNKIVKTPSSKACAQCHARDEDTVGLPTMAAMLAGFGNYATITMPGYGFDADEIKSDGLCLGTGNINDCKNDMMWFELGCKTGMGKRSQRAGVGSSDKWGMGLCTICDGYNPSQTALWNVSGTICANPALQMGCEMYGMTRDGNPSEVGQSLTGKMPDTDKHDLAGMKCATCHYALDKTIPAKTYDGVSYPSELIKKADHQFAQGYSVIEKSKNNLDGTVTCASCHLHPVGDPERHPNAGNAPLAVHAGLPAIHLNKIDCRTCHIPQVYSAPGRLKYRDWTVGWFRGLNRNQLDWNFNILTGSHDPMKNLHVWITTPEGTKIAPIQPSVSAVWTEKLTVNGNTVWEPTKIRDVSSAAAIVKGKVNDGHLPNVKFTINRATVIPLFDGFSLADALAIDTKADIDAMVDELSNSNGAGKMPHARLTDPKLALLVNLFDVSHGVVPKQYALGGSMTGGCISCHSSSNPSSPNYSPRSIGFFDRNHEMLKHPLSQLADYDCDVMVSMDMFPDVATCKSYVGGQLMPGMGMSMDGVDFIQMMAIKEGAPSTCNPMMMLFDPSGSWMTACDNDGDPSNGLAHMLTRAEAKDRFATVLQQSTTGGSNRVVWNISVGKNPSNSSHVNSWDQAQTCYNPMTQQPISCTDGGYILTQVNANQLLGYSAAKLAKLTSPIGTTKPQARLRVTRVKDNPATTPDESERGLKVKFTNVSLCPSGNCTSVLKVDTVSDATCNARVTVPLTNNEAEYTFSLNRGVWNGSFCAQLSVTDNHTGLNSTRTFPINLTKRNTKPNIEANIEALADKRAKVTFTVNDDDDETGQIRVLIVWGHGVPQEVAGSVGEVTKTDPYPNVTRKYNVRVTAIDSKGGRTRVTVPVTITATSP